MSKRKQSDNVKDSVENKFNNGRATIYDNLFSLVSWCRAIGAHFEKEHKKEQAKQIIPKRYYLYTQKFLDSRPSEADQLLLDLRGALSTFDALGFQRSAHQRKFHESMIAGPFDVKNAIYLVCFVQLR